MEQARDLDRNVSSDPKFKIQMKNQQINNILKIYFSYKN